MNGRHRVVVVGGGFAGLFATRFLRRGDVGITLLDRTNHHLFQPLLYQVASGEGFYCYPDPAYAQPGFI